MQGGVLRKREIICSHIVSKCLCLDLHAGSKKTYEGFCGSIIVALSKVIVDKQIVIDMHQVETEFLPIKGMIISIITEPYNIQAYGSSCLQIGTESEWKKTATSLSLRNTHTFIFTTPPLLLQAKKKHFMFSVF